MIAQLTMGLVYGQKSNGRNNMEQTTTQAKLILNHLQRRPITPIDALSLYGCFRLGARIYDLRKDGHHIEKRPYKTPTGKTVAQYFIPNQQQ